MDDFARGLLIGGLIVLIIVLMLGFSMKQKNRDYWGKLKWYQKIVLVIGVLAVAGLVLELVVR